MEITGTDIWFTLGLVAWCILVPLAAKFIWKFEGQVVDLLVDFLITVIGFLMILFAQPAGIHLSHLVVLFDIGLLLVLFVITAMLLDSVHFPGDSTMSVASP